MLTAQSVLVFTLSPLLCFCSLAAQTTGALVKRSPEQAEQMQQSERRVTLDVQVTDASGKPVSGLQSADLTLLDNGRPQPLTSFQEISATGVTLPAEVILLLDTMNASFDDVVIERQGIEAFLRQNGGHLALPVSIVFLADTGVKLGKSSQDGNALAEDLRKLPTPMRVLGTAQGAYGAQDRSQRSLRAAQLLATYESTRPGRKLLVWVGPGWPMLARSTAGLSSLDTRRYFSSIVDITTALRRANITLYNVSPFNLAQGTGQNFFLYETYLKGVENPTQADSPNLALQVLAVHSGGLVLGRTGDLAGQIALCMADAKDYYAISFDAATSDPAKPYHALQVKVDRPGNIARTGAAYYAGVPQTTSGPIPSVPAASSMNTPATQVIKTEARLVVVDVTALDKKGQPITGLKSSDFQLNEDKAPQKIVSLEEHKASGDASAAASADATAKATADGVVVASNAPPVGSTWNVVLIDLYNTPNEARGRLQSQLEQFLKQLPEREPVALVTMSSRIKVETSFQDGAVAAYRYLHKNGLGPVDATTPANIVEVQAVAMPSADTTGSAIVNQANVDVDLQANRARTTLECFSALAKWLTPYPGRKIVYWLSGGFPLQGQPFGVGGYNNDGVGPETKSGHPLPMQPETEKELERARVAIYPVDARGVAPPEVEGVTTADTTFNASVGVGTAKDNALKAARAQEMLEIAKATGGTAHFDNDIAQALRDDFNQANTYYTLTYTPPDKEWKGVYHHIQLSIDQPDAELIYRAGYYARESATESSPTPEQFKDALRPGTPAELSVQFTSKITKSSDLATVEYGVEPNTVDFQQDPSGQLLIDIDFAIMESNAKGKVLDNSLIRLSGKMTQAQRAHLSSKTLTARQTIPLKSGATTLILGVRDRTSGRFGKVEVPLTTH